ncbi:tripartite tricarboxylate transporter TctB family protein [Acidobacteriota bacterium]
MKVDKSRFAFTTLLLIFVLVMITASFNYDPKARLIPLLIGLATLILVVPVLFNQIHPISLVKKLDINLIENHLVKQRSIPTDQVVPEKRFFIFLFWITGLFIIIFSLGFYVGIALFTFAFLKIEGKVSWAKALIATAIGCGAIFIVFELAMGIRLFKGLFCGEILPQI